MRVVENDRETTMIRYWKLKRYKTKTMLYVTLYKLELPFSVKRKITQILLEIL